MPSFFALLDGVAIAPDVTALPSTAGSLVALIATVYALYLAIPKLLKGIRKQFQSTVPPRSSTQEIPVQMPPHAPLPMYPTENAFGPEADTARIVMERRMHDTGRFRASPIVALPTPMHAHPGLQSHPGLHGGLDESVELRLLRIEKQSLGEQLQEVEAEKERYRGDVVILQDENANLKEQLIAKDRANAGLRREVQQLQTALTLAQKRR